MLILTIGQLNQLLSCSRLSVLMLLVNTVSENGICKQISKSATCTEVQVLGASQNEELKSLVPVFLFWRKLMTSTHNYSSGTSNWSLDLVRVPFPLEFRRPEFVVFLCKSWFAYTNFNVRRWLLCLRKLSNIWCVCCVQLNSAFITFSGITTLLISSFLTNVDQVFSCK